MDKGRSGFYENGLSKIGSKNPEKSDQRTFIKMNLETIFLPIFVGFSFTYSVLSLTFYHLILMKPQKSNAPYLHL